MKIRIVLIFSLVLVAFSSFGQTKIGNPKGYVEVLGFLRIDSFGTSFPFFDSTRDLPPASTNGFVFLNSVDTLPYITRGGANYQMVTLNSIGKVPLSQIPGGLGEGTVTSVNINSNHIFLVTTANASTNPVSTLAERTVNAHKFVGNSSNARGALDTSLIRGIDLPDTGTAGTYGSATQVPVFATDAKGRIVSVTNTAISAYSAGNYILLGSGVFSFDTGRNNLNLNSFTIGKGKTNSATNVIAGMYADTAMNSATNNVYAGGLSGQKNRTGHDNVAVGYSTFINDTAVNNSVAIGSLAASVFRSTSATICAGGKNSFTSTTTGASNTGWGNFTGEDNVTGQNNAFFGFGAGQHSTANGNTSIGASSLSSATLSGANNCAFGLSSGAATTSGASNLFLGTLSGSSITTGSKNVIIGSHTGVGLTTLSNFMLFSDGDANIRMYIPSTGNVIIGNDTTDNRRDILQVRGTAYVSTVPTGGANNAMLTYSSSGQVTQIPFRTTIVASGNTTQIVPAIEQLVTITFTPVGTETIKIGTTSGGVDVMPLTVFTAGTTTTVVFNKVFDRLLPITLFIQGAIGSVTYDSIIY